MSHSLVIVVTPNEYAAKLQEQHDSYTCAESSSELAPGRLSSESSHINHQQLGEGNVW